MGARPGSRGFDPYLLLFVLGVIIAAGYAARPAADGLSSVARVGDWARHAGAPFAFGLALMVTGGLLARARRRRALGASNSTVGATGELTAGSPVEAARVVIERVRGSLLEASELDVHRDAEALADRLDQILERDVTELLNLKDALMMRLGLVHYAVFIGHFSSTERNVARAWSALTDEAWSEVRPSLERARSALERASAQLADGQPGRVAAH